MKTTNQNTFRSAHGEALAGFVPGTEQNNFTNTAQDDFASHADALSIFLNHEFQALQSQLPEIARSTYRDKAVVQFLHDYMENLKNIPPEGHIPQVKENLDSDMTARISENLRRLGVPAHLKGFHYLREAIRCAVNDPSMLQGVTKVLYPTVAKTFGSTSSRVERTIRHAIEVAWDRGDLDTLHDVFGYTVNSNKGKPTNSEFIALIADNLRFEQQHRSAV